MNVCKAQNGITLFIYVTLYIKRDSNCIWNVCESEYALMSSYNTS